MVWKNEEEKRIIGFEEIGEIITIDNDYYDIQKEEDIKTTINELTETEIKQAIKDGKVVGHSGTIYKVITN